MTELSDDQRQQILDTIKAGKKIQAIKLYREQTGLGLKEAKQFIDELTKQLLEQDPNAIQSSGAGCGTSAAMLTLLVLLACFEIFF